MRPSLQQRCEAQVRNEAALRKGHKLEFEEVMKLAAMMHVVLVLEDRQGANPAMTAGTTSAVAQAVVEELVLILISIIVTAIVVNSIVRSGH